MSTQHNEIEPSGLDDLEATRGDDNDEESTDAFVLVSMPCPDCGKPFGPETDAAKGMVIPQQLHPCGHSICATCIQGWSKKCTDAEAPVACTVCHNPVTGIVPNRLYCDFVLEVMRAQLLPEEIRDVLIAQLKSTVEMLSGLLLRGPMCADVIVSLRAAAQREHNDADLLRAEVTMLRQQSEQVNALHQANEAKQQLNNTLLKEINRLKTQLEKTKTASTDSSKPSIVNE